MTNTTDNLGRESRIPQTGTSVNWWIADDRWSQIAPHPVRGLLPGAFNPLHQGHLKLHEVATALLGGPVAFELSVENVEKPPLAESELRRRCRQFSGQSVAVTHAPTFVEKSLLFGGMTFVVGADTALRIVDPRFYGNSTRAMIKGLETIAGHGCRFLVAARLCEDRLLTLEDLAIPSEQAGLFAAIPTERFRLDVSSTDLRQQA